MDFTDLVRSAVQPSSVSATGTAVFEQLVTRVLSEHLDPEHFVLQVTRVLLEGAPREELQRLVSDLINRKLVDTILPKLDRLETGVPPGTQLGPPKVDTSDPSRNDGEVKPLLD